MDADQDQQDAHMQLLTTLDDGYRRLLPPTTRLSSRWTTITGSYIFKDAFQLHTLLAIGAALQLLCATVVARPWCFVPAAALLSLSAVTTAVQVGLGFGRAGRKNAFLSDAVPGRSTARIWPSTETETEAGAPVVVFHFGARFNHPLGLLAPGGRTMTVLFKATIAELEMDRAGSTSTSQYGLLGANLFRGGERASNDTILLVLYFCDVAGLQRFARSAIHERAYRWLRANQRRYAHLSAFHETFSVPAGCYETLYINTAPVLLGNAYTREDRGDQGDQGDKGRDGPKTAKARETSWINSLVDANDVRLETMAARLKHGTISKDL